MSSVRLKVQRSLLTIVVEEITFSNKNRKLIGFLRSAKEIEEAKNYLIRSR